MTSTSRGVAISTVGNLIPPVVALVTQPILAQGLGVAGRGELAAATAPLLFATAILTIGLPESLTYHLARQAAGIARLTRLSVGTLSLVGLAGSGVVALLAGPLSAGDAALARLIMVAGIAITPTLIIAALRGLAAGAQAWRLIAAERILNALLRLAAVLTLYAVGALTPMTATIVVATTSFIGGTLYLRLLRGIRTPDFTAAGNAEPARLFRYASQVWLGAVTGVMLSRFDQLLMTPLAGVEQLGYYAVAVSVSEVILVFNSSVRDVMFAVESHGPDPNRVARASRLSTLMTLAGAIAIAAVAPWAIPFFFGSSFAAATPVTLVLLFGVVLGNPGSVAGAALSGRGRPGLRSLSLFIASAVNAIAVFILVPSFGAIGAAAATLIGNVVAGNLNIVWLRAFFGMRVVGFYSFRAADFGDLLTLLKQLIARRG